VPPARAAEHRQAFADACNELGPDAPTLCEGWTTKDLVAHVYVREHRPDAAPGVLPLGPWSAYTGRVMNSVLRVHDYATLVEQVWTPPRWLEVTRLEDAINTVEFSVHAEDVRRANGREPRPTDDRFERWLWRRLRRQAKLMFRRVPAQVRLVPDVGDPVDVGKAARSGDSAAVEVRGKPSEILLLAYNRKEVARVTVVGARDALMSARLGL
jgi:uncharacterized protein (TIGR03085 family)